MQAISGGLRDACSENNGQLNFDKVEHLKSIKTSRKLPDGIYIRGSVQGYPIIFTADTGASKTVISRGTYEAMDPADKPALVKSARLVGPTGTVINELGKGTFSLKLGEVEIEVEAVVADIDDDGLLGIDVLQDGQGGPADLLLSKGVLQVQDEEVPLIQVGLKRRVQRVTADHTIMPAQAEAVIRRVFTDRHDYSEVSTVSERIIKPTEHCSETYPLRMAATLVEFNQGRSCMVGLSNTKPNNKLFKEVDSSEEKSTDSMVKGTDSAKVARADVQASGVVSPYQRVKEVSTAKKGDLLCSAMVGTATVSEAKKTQLEDPDIGPVLPAKVAGIETDSHKIVTKSPTCRHYAVLWDELVLHCGMEKTGAGHLGYKKTKMKILMKYYWYALKEDVTMAVKKYEKGNLVWYLNEVKPDGGAPRLKPVYRGPVPVKSKVTAVSCNIQLDESCGERLIHRDKLKPRMGDQFPKWAKKARKMLKN